MIKYARKSSFLALLLHFSNSFLLIKVKFSFRSLNMNFLIRPMMGQRWNQGENDEICSEMFVLALLLDFFISFMLNQVGFSFRSLNMNFWLRPMMGQWWSQNKNEKIFTEMLVFGVITLLSLAFLLIKVGFSSRRLNMNFWQPHIMGQRRSQSKNYKICMSEVKVPMPRRMQQCRQIQLLEGD